MKKIFTLLTVVMLSSLALFSQQEIPAWFESIYSVVGESALAPDTADAQATLRLLGPGADWNADIYDFTDYTFIDVKLRYHQADTGKQVALRYYAKGAVNVDLIDLPSSGSDTSYTIRLHVPGYAREDDSVKFGGIWLYNGATHWSFSYTGEPATQATIVDYVAIKKKPDIPEGWVSIFSLNENFEKAPVTVDAQTTYQLTGPGANWHLSKDYNITNYDTLALKIKYHGDDVGKEVAIRFAINGDGQVQSKMITLPDVPDTTLIIQYVTDTLPFYKDADSNVWLGGFLFYPGSSHWSLTYTDPATMPTIIEYMALSLVPVEGLTIEPEDEDLAKALPFDVATTLNVVFTPVNASNQAVTWSSGDETKAVVDENGVVTAQHVPGDVIITAVSVENEAITANYTVTVVGEQVNVTGVSFTDDSISIKIGFGGGPLEYSIQPENASVKSVSWATSDTNIATVDEDGIISSVSAGSAKIYAITDDGGFTDSCNVTIEGYKEIPLGYASLYSLEYNNEGVLILMDTITTPPGADVPGMFITQKDHELATFLGTTWWWNGSTKYVDLSNYSELVISATFKKEDVGKQFILRYCFSLADSTDDYPSGSALVNRTVAIDQEEMMIVIDLENDTADIEGLKRLGAIKLMQSPDYLDLVVDYLAVKKLDLSSDATLSDIKLAGISMFGFDPEQETYNVNLTAGTTSITVTATTNDASAEVEITDDGNIDVSSGSAIVTLTVTAEDGTEKVYTINFTVASSVADVLNANMNIYPTISKGSFNVEFEQLPGTLTVFDLTGRRVMHKTVYTSRNEINLSAGLYMVILESNGVSKIVKVACIK